MKSMILIACATTMVLAMPALADPGGNKNKGKGHAERGAVYGNGDRRVVTVDRRACPPGLAKKNNGCLPPGQARKLYARGDRLPTGFRSFTDYRNIPLAYRSQVTNADQYRYIFRDDRLYVVDPTTRLITRIVQALR